MALPSNEILWETFSIDGKPKYFVTSTKSRDYYILYGVKPNGLIRLGKAKTPPELYKKFVHITLPKTETILREEQNNDSEKV